MEYRATLQVSVEMALAAAVIAQRSLAPVERGLVAKPVEVFPEEAVAAAKLQTRAALANLQPEATEGKSRALGMAAPSWAAQG